MSQRTSPYVDFDIDNIEPVGYCDRTGFLCMRKDLVKQYEYSGQNLVWLGIWVHKDFLDKPNPSLKPTILKPDPVAVKDPRPGWAEPGFNPTVPNIYPLQIVNVENEFGEEEELK